MIAAVFTHGSIGQRVRTSLSRDLIVASVKGLDVSRQKVKVIIISQKSLINQPHKGEGMTRFCRSYNTGIRMGVKGIHSD